MKCREVLPLLPGLVDDGPPADVARHLESCADCAAELAGYRRQTLSLSRLEALDLDPPPAFMDRVLLTVPALPGAEDARSSRSRARAVRYALVSAGGVALGAGALGIVWWRAARRGVNRAPARDLVA
jgi:hypothetical protein